MPWAGKFQLKEEAEAISGIAPFTLPKNCIEVTVRRWEARI